MAPNFIGGHFASFFFVILAFAALIFSGIHPNGVSGIRSAVSDKFAPLLSAISLPSQNTISFVKDFTGLTNLQAENARLTQENAQLREWYQTAILLQNENKSLKDLLNLKVESRHSFITARVLTDTGNTFVKNILVMAGSNDGVDESQAVISGEGVIGRIIETGHVTARVLLVTDINSRLPVILEGTQQQAILAGRNDDLPTLVHIPVNQKIAEGTRVITSGLGGIFPPGLPIGRVHRDQTGIYTVKPFADLDRLTYVKIIDQPDDPNLYQAGDSSRLD